MKIFGVVINGYIIIQLMLISLCLMLLYFAYGSIIEDQRKSDFCNENGYDDLWYIDSKAVCMKLENNEIEYRKVRCLEDKCYFVRGG